MRSSPASGKNIFPDFFIFSLDNAGNGCILSALCFTTICRGIAQPGRALGSGLRGRKFKSCCPDHFFCPDSGQNRKPVKTSLHTRPACFLIRRIASCIGGALHKSALPDVASPLCSEICRFCIQTADKQFFCHFFICLFLYLKQSRDIVFPGNFVCKKTITFRNGFGSFLCSGIKNRRSDV